MSKPVHPATVHFPIAFLTLAYGIDILTTLPLPTSISSNLPPTTDLTRASYYLLSLGLLTSLPTIASGGSQALQLFQKQGMYEADGKTLKTKVKATIAHAVVNDVVLAANAFVWWSRRKAAEGTLMGKLGAGTLATSEAAYVPATWMVVMEALSMGLLFFGANIGGSLTYNYGVGFSAASSKGKKQ